MRTIEISMRFFDDWVMEEFQRRLVEAAANAEWAGSDKLMAVFQATCEPIRWIQSIGRSNDWLVGPVAESRMRILLLQIVEYGLNQKLLTSVGNPKIASKVASSTLYVLAEEWVSARKSAKNSKSFLPEIIGRLSGVLLVNDSPPMRKSRDFAF